MNNGITKENMLFTLPIALREDKTTKALAEAAAEVLAARLAEVDRLRIISNIDSLEKGLLDILAYDFKVDWWDPDYSLEEKRRTLKDSWRVHKLLGTKAAVVTAISAIYPDTRVEEWFEYGGRPYGFKIHINLPKGAWSEDRPRLVIERAEFYKSLRSHLDEIATSTPLDPVELPLTPVFAETYSETALPELRPAGDFAGGVFLAGICWNIMETALPELKSREEDL